METTYKVQGPDGNEYGPVTLPQLQGWIAEGRVTGASHILRNDQTAWLPATNYSELQFAPAVAGPAPSAAAASPHLLEWQKRSRSGANWFYWIAGLSLINSIVALTGSGWGFMLGLGVTQIISFIASGMGSTGIAVALVLDILAAAVFVLFGVFANKLHLWAFVVGMVLYALDGLIYLLSRDWLSLGFHVFALFCIFAGFRAAQQYKAATRPVN